MAERMQLTRLVAASPEEVFDAWTRAEILGRWFAPDPLSASVPSSTTSSTPSRTPPAGRS